MASRWTAYVIIQMLRATLASNPCSILSDESWVEVPIDVRTYGQSAATRRDAERSMEVGIDGGRPELQLASNTLRVVRPSRALIYMPRVARIGRQDNSYISM